MKKTAYNVTVDTLTDQLKTTLDELAAEANADRLKALAEFGIDGPKFTKKLQAAYDSLSGTKAGQERTKGDYEAETGDDQALAEQGYRWKLRLDSRVRCYISQNGDKEDLAGQFRFGQLHAPRAKGVRIELLIVLDVAKKYAAKLAPFGVTPAFLAEGKGYLDKLGGPTASVGTKAKRGKETKAVRKLALTASQLLAQLVEADEAYALDHEDETTVFRIDRIRAEEGRLRAERKARLAATGPNAEPADGEGSGHAPK